MTRTDYEGGLPPADVLNIKSAAGLKSNLSLQIPQLPIIQGKTNDDKLGDYCTAKFQE
jgi:hypothetical protein